MRRPAPRTAAVVLTPGLLGWSAQAQVSDVPSQPPATALPRVRLVATGGTISNKAGGRLTAEELVSLMPNVGRYARPTRAGSGRIAARARLESPTTAAAPNPRDHAIAGEDLAPVKARILLMLALTKTQSGADIQRMFIEY